MKVRNPFEYVGANDLSGETILDYYIEDFNFSRFVSSTRNVFLVGERGCGKSMTLLYSSLPVQQLRAVKSGQPCDFKFIGIYVPCNTPLNHKREQQLLDEFRSSVISEHYFVISLAFNLAKTLEAAGSILSVSEEESFAAEVEYLLDGKLPPSGPLFKRLMQLLEKKNLEAQRVVNSRENLDVFFAETYSFATLVIPLLRLCRSTKGLQNSHFAFLIDDAQDLNDHQRKSLFSWVAFRDHSLFSLKVAITNLERISLKTSSGGSILEGHDYTRINMIQPFQNEGADFGKLATLLIQRRLAAAGLGCTPDEFFPVSDAMVEKLEESAKVVRAEAEAKYPGDAKKIADYVYKYKRAHFFRNRPSTSNRAEYSGFDMLVFLSTGVVRNLLMPCYWMFDKCISMGSGTTADLKILQIDPAVQSEVIVEHSRRLWEFAERELDKNLEGCSRDDARRAHQLLDQLAVLFRERLLKHKSEPRANSFTISGRKNLAMEPLAGVIEILVTAQLIYVRAGAAKDKGRQERYYVPNRMLWPSRGLDPHGQHARVSLLASDLWDAAEKNKPLPFEDREEKESVQMDLFNE
jgi:hypothetical protein